MSFRIKLPFEEIPNFSKVAADGQMGCIIKLFSEWKLSGDDDFLRKLYPKAKSVLSYAWIKGGWDGNQDGVMEGLQHNTMDVEYYGPNPQMTIWYLGALRAMEEMANYLKDKEMTSKCRKLFINGSNWTDKNLFNGEYYYQKIEVPKKEDIPKEQLVRMGSTDYGKPDYQLGNGCLVDQLVGQYMAHVCGLGYLVQKENVAKTLRSIIKYNYKSNFSDHFNCFRSFALGNEAECGHHYGRAMASWSAILTLTGFQYSGVNKEIKFGDIHGKFFWSNGYSYGTVEISQQDRARLLILKVLNGEIDISKVTIEGFGSYSLRTMKSIQSGEEQSFIID